MDSLPPSINLVALIDLIDELILWSTVKEFFTRNGFDPAIHETIVSSFSHSICKHGPHISFAAPFYVRFRRVEF